MSSWPLSSRAARALRGAISSIILLAAISGCEQRPSAPLYPTNHRPVISNLFAVPDSIGPSDSIRVVCIATDPDGDSLVYDWETDARLHIKGNPDWKLYLYNQWSSECTFFNANLSNPINDSAWVFCGVRDPRGGGTGRRVWVFLK